MDQEKLERGGASLFQMHCGCQSLCFQLVYCKNGVKDIPRLTTIFPDTTGPSWLGPKSPHSIQNHFDLSKEDNVCQ